MDGLSAVLDVLGVFSLEINCDYAEPIAAGGGLTSAYGWLHSRRENVSRLIVGPSSVEPGTVKAIIVQDL